MAEALAPRPIVRHIVELGLVSLAFLFYFLVRGSVVDRTSDALAHGFRIIDLEQNAGFFWELQLQALVVGRQFLVQMFNFIYFWFDFPLIVTVGLWLYFRHRRQYTLTRDAMLISGGIALIIYHLFPVAPPRYLSEFGFVDTMAVYSPLSYQAQSARPFVNPYAAVPSLHVGWPVLLAVGVIWATRFKPIWLAAVMLPVAQFFAVVFTANHFIFDTMVGVGVALIGLAAAVFLQKWGYIALGRLLGLVPKPLEKAKGAAT
ncbi:MAG: phosphatase PAP2 family protein [Dehalococcoidia bacterium]